jgi:hypothetical protein
MHTTDVHSFLDPSVMKVKAVVARNMVLVILEKCKRKFVR